MSHLMQGAAAALACSLVACSSEKGGSLENCSATLSGDVSATSVCTSDAFAIDPEWEIYVTHYMGDGAVAGRPAAGFQVNVALPRVPTAGTYAFPRDGTCWAYVEWCASIVDTGNMFEPGCTSGARSWNNENADCTLTIRSIDPCASTDAGCGHGSRYVSATLDVRLTGLTLSAEIRPQ